MSKKKILLVEDDPNFGIVLKDYLTLSGYIVTHAKDGLDGLIEFKNNDFDMCILDVMMPRKDGFSLAMDIRKNDKEIPIIFLTARSMKEDILKGYQVGADDYLNKPFDSEVLLHKINVILMRKSVTTDSEDETFEFQIGGFHLNSKLRQLTFTGSDAIKLSPKENKLLRLLAIHKNDLMPRELALTKIWREDNYFTSRSMDVYIAKLRRYLKEDSSVEIINIHGEGFRLMTQ